MPRGGTLWDGLRERLDLGRIAAGDRRTWTVSLAHGIYLIRLDQSPLGNRLFVDGHEVARSGALDFERPLRFDLGEAAGVVRFTPNTRTGTLSTELLVAGERVAPDRPASAVRRLRPVPWRAWLERAAYALAVALIVSGLFGDPFAAVVSRIVWTGALLIWTSGASAIDPFGLVPLVVEHGLAGAPSMIVLGAEIVVLTALARDRFGLRSRSSLLTGGHWAIRGLIWTALVIDGIALLVIAA